MRSCVFELIKTANMAVHMAAPLHMVRRHVQCPPSASLLDHRRYWYGFFL